MEFDEIVSKALKAIDEDSIFHQPRQAIDKKNKLKSKSVNIAFVRDKIKRSKSENCRTIPGRDYKGQMVHEIKVDKWYIKFFFEGGAVNFISVHKLN